MIYQASTGTFFEYSSRLGADSKPGFHELVNPFDAGPPPKAGVPEWSRPMPDEASRWLSRPEEYIIDVHDRGWTLP